MIDSDTYTSNTDEINSICGVDRISQMDQINNYSLYPTCTLNSPLNLNNPTHSGLVNLNETYINASYIDVSKN